MQGIQLEFDLTTEISELYASFKGEAISLLATGIKIGEKLNEADNCPGFDFGKLPFGDSDAKVFRNLYARRDEISEQLFMDMMLLPTVRPRNPLLSGPAVRWGEFLQPINSLSQWVRKRLEEFPNVSDWPEMHRSHLRDRLKPIVELYEKL